MDDDFWEDLLTLIEAGKVIPVIGERAVTMSPNDTVLYDWLALRLAERLGIPPENLPGTPSLNQVVTAWLLKGKHPAFLPILMHVGFRSFRLASLPFSACSPS